MMAFLLNPNDALGRRQWLCVTLVIVAMLIAGVFDA